MTGSAIPTTGRRPIHSAWESISRQNPARVAALRVAVLVGPGCSPTGQIHCGELLVARAVVKMGGRLTGDEVRFLRTFLELSGVELAELMDSTPGTVSRWENNRTPVGRTADLLLRTITRGEVDPIKPDAHSMLDLVRSFVVKLDEKRRSTVYPFRLAGNHWELAELRAARAAAAAPARTRRSSRTSMQRNTARSSATSDAASRTRSKQRSR